VYLWRGVLLTMFSHAAAQRRSALPRVKGFVAPPRRRVKRKYIFRAMTRTQFWRILTVTLDVEL
jgi:hypothetical protein